MNLAEATSFVQDKVLQEEESEKVVRIYEKQQVIRDAMAGDIDAPDKVKCMIENVLKTNNVEIEDVSLSEAVEKIYASVWGLSVVEKYYRDITVDEIRVNSPDNIYIVRRGKTEKVKGNFRDEEEVEQVIKRMILEDVGISLDMSNPIVESVRKDGSRLTATCYPVSKTWTFVLRKHGTFDVTVENLEKHGTLDKKVWKALSVLAKGRAKILISGNVGAGKTTLLRKLVDELDPALRILVIGTDLELLLSNHYPERDILELEEHPHLDADMKALFRAALRESPDAIIIEEFRGGGEAIEAIRACTKGLHGSMATAHFNSAEEAVEGTGLLLLEEGLNLDLSLAQLRVARAFNIVIQMYGDTISGIKKIVSVKEVLVDNEEIKFRELIRWEPITDNYFGKGRWVFVDQPSEQLIKHLLLSISRKEIEKAGWNTSCIAF